MEKYVELLNNRLSEDDKGKLFLMTEGAMNEIHNSGIMSQLSPEIMKKVHNPDPNIRISEKTSLAKSVGKNFIPISQPLSLETGIGHLISVVYDERFVNSISLCIQGGIEGLFQSKVWQNNKNSILEYHILVDNTANGNTEAFLANMEFLNKVYLNIDIIVKNMDFTKKEAKMEEKKKKGFLSRLFGKSFN